MSKSDNNNQMNGQGDGMGDGKTHLPQKELAKIQPSCYNDFLRYEKELYGDCDPPCGEEYTDLYEEINGGKQEEVGSFTKSHLKGMASSCCICRIPGVHKNEYLAQGHTCFRCCLIQVILLVLHLPALLMASIKEAVSWCRNGKRGSYNTADYPDETDTIEIKDFDYFWPPYDISEDEESSYKDKISPTIQEWETMDGGSSLDLIKHECILICKSNFLRRFRVLLSLMKSHFHELMDFGVELARLAATNGHPEIVKMLIHTNGRDGNIHTNRSKVGISSKLNLALLTILQTNSRNQTKLLVSNIMRVYHNL